MAEQSSLLDGDLKRDVEYRDVEKMTVFDDVLTEVLRLHPPFFQLARVVQQDTRYELEDGKGEVVIPKGHFVAVSPGVGDTRTPPPSTPSHPPTLVFITWPIQEVSSNRHAHCACV